MIHLFFLELEKIRKSYFNNWQINEIIKGVAFDFSFAKYSRRNHIWYSAQGLKVGFEFQQKLE